MKVHSPMSVFIIIVSNIPKFKLIFTCGKAPSARDEKMTVGGGGFAQNFSPWDILWGRGDLC